MSSNTALGALARELADLEAEILGSASASLAAWSPLLKGRPLPPSAENLAHYLALRRGDRTALQRRLRARGLSTLGRSEGRVLGTLRALQATLRGRVPADPPVTAQEATRELDAAANRLFGTPPRDRRTRIMVTLDPETALDPARMSAVIQAGADCVRINCAHDDATAWRAMAAAARGAAETAGRDIRVYADLAGPKLRTADLAPKPGIKIRAGDRLLLRSRHPRSHDPRNQPVVEPPEGTRAAFSCTLPEVVPQVGVGAAVAFDDGKLTGHITSKTPDGLCISVARTKPGGARLKPDKGLNFPGTILDVDPLTTADKAVLDSFGSDVDVLGYSFIQHSSDLDVLFTELHARRLAPGIVAKIETEQAFRNLPEILVVGMSHGPFGVMIARGDLGVEIGFARLSEVQEEILWLCEAAHAPVVWATEVMANLVKHGMPARGEFTDAAMGARAECVMLNKGPFQADGVAALSDVIRRSERHLDKKTPQLPGLGSWTAALSGS